MKADDLPSAYVLVLLAFLLIGLVLGGFGTYYLFPREIVTIHEVPVPIDLQKSAFLWKGGF